MATAPRKTYKWGWLAPEGYGKAWAFPGNLRR